MRTGEIVTEVIADNAQVVVQTNRSRYAAAGVVLSPGPWMAEWARKICGLEEDCFAVYRQTLYWFALQEPSPRFMPEHMPIFIWSSPKVEKGFYGFPSLDGVSIKIATEQLDTVSDANDGPATVPPEQVESFYDGYVRESLRGVQPAVFAHCYLFLHGGSGSPVCD